MRIPKVAISLEKPWRRCEGSISGVPRGRDLGCSNQPPPLNFRRPSKIVPNSARLWKPLKIAQFRTPTSQDVRKRGSKILKLPPVRNCFTLAMTNKLVVIINSLKIPKIKKILLYEVKFLVQNYSCLQNHWLRGYRFPFSLPSVLNWICWTPPPPRTKFLGTPLSSIKMDLEEADWKILDWTCMAPVTDHW